MNRVTGYKCIFASKEQTWRFALALAKEPGMAEISVDSADGAETLLDMLGDATEVLFDPATGEVNFLFGYAEIEDEDEEEEDGKPSDDDESEEDDAERNAA
ncbi:MAG: hypothetical protein JNM20_15250 [Rhizobiales bacterium]|nr:hypothetical protein [Hyphomicrobiales bacterium]